MQQIIFRELPGIGEIEEEYELYLDNRLTKPEREELEKKLDEKSLELFGITELETVHWHLPAGTTSQSQEEWERHFDFIEEPWDEEDDFWNFFGVEVTDGEGTQLACMYAFGRQLVCALKRLHPDATLTFRPAEQTDEQARAAAEAWGKRLLGGKRSY